MAQLGSFLGHSGDLRGALEESLSIAREIADGAGVAESLYWMGNMSAEVGDEKTTLRFFEDALQLAIELDYAPLIAGIQNDMAECLRANGDYAAAQPLYEQSLAFDKQANTHHGTIFALLNLATVLIQRDNIPAARERLLEALTLNAESPYGMAAAQFVIQTCAGMMAALRDWLHAARLYGASEQEREREGIINGRADELFILPLMVQAREALGEAAYQSAFSEGRGLPLELAVSEALAWLRATT